MSHFSFSPERVTLLCVQVSGRGADLSPPGPPGPLALQPGDGSPPARPPKRAHQRRHQRAERGAAPGHGPDVAAVQQEQRGEQWLREHGEGQRGHREQHLQQGLAQQRPELLPGQRIGTQRPFCAEEGQRR